MPADNKRLLKNWPVKNRFANSLNPPHRISTFLAGGNCLKSKRNAADEFNKSETSWTAITRSGMWVLFDHDC